MELIKLVVVLSILLRIGFFGFGLYQDAYMMVKYTDIDYLVFSDAAKYVYQGLSPYLRETYRYTPLLAWMLVPNCYENPIWYSFGKFVFMASDLITGLIILKLLRKLKTTSDNKLAVLSSIWLLNPMVITISTRGSSESVLTVIIMATLLFLFNQNYMVSAVCMGVAIHFKMYPVIYLPSVLLYLTKARKPILNFPLINLINTTNMFYLIVTLLTLSLLNGVMFYIYGFEFLYNSYIYHFVRLDHRHNFSVYNVLLYYKSSVNSNTNIEQFAFVPQLVLSAIVLPLMFAKQDLISCLFVQTFTFVTFNKVMTSQYFIWFLIFLPHYLSSSNLVKSKYKRGIFMLCLWVGTQGFWLYNAYQLEFLGINTFDNGLLFAACGFFLSNCWLISQFIGDM